MDRVDYRVAREKRQNDSFELIKLRLEEHPEEVEEAAEYLGCSLNTMLRRLEGGFSLGGENAIRQEGFLRRKRVLEPLEIGESPTIATALYYGLSEKLFSVNEVANALEISPNYRVIQYAYGELEPVSWGRIHLEWYLHRTTLKTKDGIEYSLREMPRLSALPIEVAKLLIACCQGDLTQAIIAEQLGVEERKVYRWFNDEMRPVPAVMERIYEQFAPYLTEEGSKYHEKPSKVSSDEKKEDKPKAEIVPIVAAVSVPEPPTPAPPATITKSTSQVIPEQGELLRCLILGFALSRQPSKAIAELEAIRMQNPDLWFELKLLVGIIADPEQYHAWRKSRR